MNITGVDFITVPTRDFDAASEFYTDVLGLTQSVRWGDMPAAEFETGTLTIAVMQSDAFGLAFAPHTHPIALHVDDVHAARAELEGKGVTFGAETLDSGVCHMAHFSDPDGNALMFHGRYAPR
ncbi:VOC family protein [Conexibacter woesei]|uniref:Glyoxalase/bleomycin resistance protein/dioxygenase n=1 Tax=Conexibacter woesei (strain DSM 14684 / CCUG 47730 / CIP 108061 / JCM 11494 / NBRC 100937 / ID131577) TaxID=469383 RepID=D3F7N8_CONWI|nr:VOC family protein [Conexibacter woesei]ADB50900.1 Glyoxalase/bleomycin resistance protein/dioxygenase [Conexibacter woesei DSM 14684]